MSLVVANAMPSAVPARRSPFSVGVAVFVALVMVSSGGLLVFSVNASLYPPIRIAPLAGPSAAHPIESGAQLQHGSYMTSPGTHYASLPNASIQSPISPLAPVRFTVGFQIRNQAQLEQILSEQATPGTPMYHHWLTTEQEAQMFGPDPVTVQNTINYFTSLGFTVGTRGAISISFVGSTGQANFAFRTQLSNVQYGGGAMAMMNTMPLSLPTPIAGGILSVNGFDSTRAFHTEHFYNPATLSDLSGSAISSSSVAPATGTVHFTNVTNGFNFTNSAYFWFQYFSARRGYNFHYGGLTPGALDTMYNATPLINAGYNGNSTGKPVTIAVVMAGGINPDDIKGYGKLVWNNPNNLWNRLTAIPVDGSFTTNGTVHYTDGGSNEMALDLEYSSTMAPGAHLDAVYGPCLCYNVLDDDYAILDSMSTTPNVITNSFGGSEDQAAYYGPNWQNGITLHTYFMLLDAKGASILFSSGDGGGFDTGTGMLSGSNSATDPYVLSVTGIRTSLVGSAGVPFPVNPSLGVANVTIPFRNLVDWPVYFDKATKLNSESFWYVPTSNRTLYSQPPSASGGFGTSYWFNQSWFQHGIGVPDLGRALGSGVAAEADFNMTIFFDGNLEWFYGGTSFGCPTTAGEFALVDDYLLAHGHGGYLGNGNVPAFSVANAWWNGNLTLNPYYDVYNGTSYWGNYGVEKGYEWPPGQKFPYNSTGATTYGTTLKGFDFPSGWGSMNVANFAYDLNTLESLPGQFQATNSAGTTWNPAAWANFATNGSYTIHVNASSALAATNPHVTVKFLPDSGTPQSYQPALTQTLLPSSGYTFILDTGTGVFTGPGTILFEFGNSSTPTLGFGFSYLAYALPTGTLNVSVVQPSGSSIFGGYPEFNPTFFFASPIVVVPSCCTPYPNSFTVRVTFNGQPVYNALVTAQIPNSNLLAWQGSRAQQVTQSYGNPHEVTSTIVSESYTNLSGYALVSTWNMIQPTTYYVNATYSSARAGTTYQVIPGPNVGTTDLAKGRYSQFNWVDYILMSLRQTVSANNSNLWVPNSVHQSGLYSLLYAWQGQEFNASTNDWQGNPMPGVRVWLGNFDGGGENKFYHYQATGGVVGVTNTSGTSAVTQLNGGSGSYANATVFIPDNQTADNFLRYPDGSTAGIAFLAASVPGEVNRTFQYTQPCAPTLPNPNNQITCEFNDTFQRNYTSVPLIILPNPVEAFTQTQGHSHRDFFGAGSNISFGVNVSLRSSDPFLLGFGTDWTPGQEHIVTARAFVDGGFAADISPDPGEIWQNWSANGNLTGNYKPGVHDLKIVVTDSVGHIFTFDHTFIVGSPQITDLTVSNTYLPIPYNLTWSLNIPAQQINNHTFNQSLEIRYLAPGCGFSTPCPQVVNFSVKIRDGITDYNQSLNITLLQSKHFYSGSDSLPPGEYNIIIWLNANHSGSIATALSTYFVFAPIFGEINGPTSNAQVPLGNVTISYSYSGEYIQNASLFVFSKDQPTSPVFSTGAFVAVLGIQPRGGAATWTAVTPGTYRVVLALGTPYGHYNTSEWFNVTSSGLVFLNQTQAKPLIGMSPALSATILALIGTIIGLLLGLFIAPALRERMLTKGGGARPQPAKPWEEGSQVSGKNECPACHDTFETPFALAQHQKMVHGIEE